MTQHSSAEPDPPRVRNSAGLGGARGADPVAVDQAARGTAGIGVGRGPGTERGDRANPRAGPGRDRWPRRRHREPDLDRQPDGAFAHRARPGQAPRRLNGPVSASVPPPPSTVAQPAAVDRYRGGRRRFDPGCHLARRRRPGLLRASVASTGGVTAMIRSPLARRMLEVVLAEPILLSPDERYLHGHYLAYLLSGSRRRGLFLRRPMEPRNADRGRLLLAHDLRASWPAATEEAIADAAALLDQRIDVRAALSPIVVAKYLTCRGDARQAEAVPPDSKAIAETSAYAQKQMIDTKGVLNPGLDAPEAGGPPVTRPVARRGRRRAGRAVEPRRRGLAQRDRVPHRRACATPRAEPTATRPAPACGPRSSIL